MSDAIARHLPPGNCKALQVPSVNQCIWRHMGTGIRNTDLKIQNVLKVLTAGITAFARTLTESDMNQDHKDALALLCNLQYELNYIRKSAIQPTLDPKFAGLCKPGTSKQPMLLFGGDLPKQVKQLDEASKALGLIKAATKTYFGKRYQPYGPPRRATYSAGSAKTRSTQQRSFLGHGPGRPPGRKRSTSSENNKEVTQPPLVTMEVGGSGSSKMNKSTKVGGRLRYYLHAWNEITLDTHILSSIQGYTIEFILKHNPPVQHAPN
ncbi:uncharacterized protein LOC129704052 [Leucoraja erinacea]|uniref:uncharacterized protein LOC129704052 n=1 Tax=Leucoraja erinaceus TaxID=7782 RepID=UPI0024580107|nr:uncharacterized protein LOC129704052 [Leucoraja erinacea]